MKYKSQKLQTVTDSGPRGV